MKHMTGVAGVNERSHALARDGCRISPGGELLRLSSEPFAAWFAFRGVNPAAPSASREALSGSKLTTAFGVGSE